ncbi:hypothetical protein HRUBRA_00015 [Pseudohaliea rubra DSM 19751]|uniref:Uncharacterized protein n=1 Tax=Pseudohaliea rubra DSM 19751 TaxID=1265313 RepID=A0A095VVE7_9GAMM|nr:hypothetical protein HRUBRA_00015 [Pseudohaliea rubra DSM 19751]
MRLGAVQGPRRRQGGPRQPSHALRRTAGSSVMEACQCTDCSPFSPCF